jgi:hypothetical protein
MTATTTSRRSTLAIPRTRGLVTGLCLMVLGAWGGIIPFVGPYFGYAFINHQAWHFTYGRLWLDILPGAVVLLAGLILFGAGSRVSAVFAGWLAAVGGAWFVIGPEVSRLWNHGALQTGHPIGGYVRQTFEWLGYHYALGAVVVFFAAFAIGRVSVVAARDVLVAERRGRWGRRRAVGTTTAADGRTETPERAVPGPRATTTREPVSAGRAGSAPVDRPDTTA